MPFRVMGQLLDDSSGLKVFLQRGEQVYAVGAGDVITGTYRVAAISATNVTLTYLPLNMSQILPLGNTL
jgi:hypothetical protein